MLYIYYFGHIFTRNSAIKCVLIKIDDGGRTRKKFFGIYCTVRLLNISNRCQFSSHRARNTKNESSFINGLLYFTRQPGPKWVWLKSTFGHLLNNRTFIIYQNLVNSLRTGHDMKGTNISRIFSFQIFCWMRHQVFVERTNLTILNMFYVCTFNRNAINSKSKI